MPAAQPLLQCRLCRPCAFVRDGRWAGESLQQLAVPTAECQVWKCESNHTLAQAIVEAKAKVTIPCPLVCNGCTCVVNKRPVCGFGSCPFGQSTPRTPARLYGPWIICKLCETMVCRPVVKPVLPDWLHRSSNHRNPGFFALFFRPPSRASFFALLHLLGSTRPSPALQGLRQPHTRSRSLL